MPKFRVIEAQQISIVEIWSYDVEADDENAAIARVRSEELTTDEGPHLVTERYTDADTGIADYRGFAIDRGDEQKAIELAVAVFEEECE